MSLYGFAVISASFDDFMLNFNEFHSYLKFSRNDLDDDSIHSLITCGR